LAEAEASARLVRRYFEMWNTGEGAVADEVLGPRYVDHAHPDVIGPAAARSIAPRFHKAHPDARMTFEILGADEEYVAVRNTIRKASKDGQAGEVSGTALFRIGGGRIVEQWSWYPGTKKGR
jgi:predicted SnoaL-like aldol condensation-catalyzing enzyme